MKRLLVLLLLVAACSDASAGPSSTTSPSLVSQSSVASSTTAIATTMATTATTAPEAVLGDGVESLDLAAEVFGASRVERFRARTVIVSSSDPDETNILFSSAIDAAYQRAPDAIALAVETTGAGGGDVEVEIVAIGDEYWVREAGGPWEQDPAVASLLSLANVSLLSPATLEVILPVLEEVGEEQVAGRPAVHLRGGAAELQVFMSTTGIRDLNAFSELLSGSIDLWLDRAGFVSKAEYRFGGVVARTLDEEYYRAEFELSDFDGDFEIEPPA